MEENSANSSGSPHNPISVVMAGGVVPPPPPPPIKTIVVQTPTTSGSGIIPLMNLTIVPSIKNLSDAPFSYGMTLPFHMGCQVFTLVRP